MNKSTKLQPIADIRKQQEQNAGRAHGESIRQVEQQQNQLNELITNRNQYTKAFQSAAKSGLSAIQMQEYRFFINRLDEAITQQEQHVINGQNRCKVSQQEWMTKRSKRKIINKVVESRELAENQRREKNEQKELEDRPHRVFGNH